MKRRNINSIDGLAALTQEEFLAVGERFDGLERKVDDGVKALVDILDLMRADLRDVKIALGPLVRTVASLEDSVRGLDRRVIRLEEKTRARG
jgi:hypothetical protein